MTIYPSAISAAKLGVGIDPRYQGRNVLKEITEEAASFGLGVIPWLESGLKIPFTVTTVHGENPGTTEFPIGHRAKKNGWLLTLANGAHKLQDPINNAGWGYLDPTNPEVINYFEELTKEIVTQPGVSGLMIDDHFGIAPDFENGAKYRQDAANWCKKMSCTGNPKQNIERFSVENIIGLADAVGKSIRLNSRGQRKIFMLAPGGRHGFSRSRLRQDWHEIARRRIVDELVIQTYRYSLPGFLNELGKLELSRTRQTLSIPISIGILMGIGSNRDPKRSVPGKLIYQQVRAARTATYGVSFFYSDQIWRPASGQNESNEERFCWIRAMFAGNAKCDEFSSKPTSPIPDVSPEPSVDPEVPDAPIFDDSPITLPEDPGAAAASPTPEQTRPAPQGPAEGPSSGPIPPPSQPLPAGQGSQPSATP